MIRLIVMMQNKLVGVKSTLDNVGVEAATIKRRDQVRTLDHLHGHVKIGKQTVHIDPMLLFTRLILLAQGRRI